MSLFSIIGFPILFSLSDLFHIIYHGIQLLELCQDTTSRKGSLEADGL